MLRGMGGSVNLAVRVLLACCSFDLARHACVQPFFW